MERDIRVVLKEQVVSQGATRHGLVIGIEKYENPKLNLKYVRRDAEAIRDVMVSSECGLFEERNVQLLVDEHATYSAIRRAFSKLIQDANTEDTVWIFYAGHGAVEGAETYWVTHDADIHDLFGTALPSRDISHFLDRISAKRVVTFLDCCHAEATVQAGTRQVLTAEEAFAAFQGEGRFTVCSCEGDQKSVELEEQEHGAFTHFLVEGLRGAADADGQGVVLAEDLWKYLEDRVTNAARKAKNPQTPRLISNVSHRLALTLNALELTKTAALEEKIMGLFGRGPDRLTGAQCDLALRLLHDGPSNAAEERLAQYIEALTTGTPEIIRMFKDMVEFLGRLEVGPPHMTPQPQSAVPPHAEPSPPETPPQPAQPPVPQVSFESNPSGADVVISGQSHGPTPLESALEPGEHEAIFEFPGYVSKTEQFRCHGLEDMAVQVILEPQPPVVVTVNRTMAVHEEHPHISRQRLDFFPPGGSPFELRMPTGETITACMGTGEARTHVHSQPEGTIQRWWRTSGIEEGDGLRFELVGPRRYTMAIEKRSTTPVEVGVAADGAQNVEAKLPGGLVPPSGDSDKYGNPVRQGTDPESGLPLEAVLAEVAMPLVLCPAGEFMMGEDSDEHRVVLTKPFYLGKYQVTQREWEALVGSKPWSGEDAVKEKERHAASCISWDDTQGFFEKLAGETGLDCRLPTEAEWEYACRAGSTSTWCFGDDESQLPDYAWYDENTNDVGEEYAHGVGLKKANAWSLYDVHGNVWEWCQDWYDSDYYSSSPTEDPAGPDSGEYRVLRGGSWYGSAPNACCPYRDYHGVPTYRFRSGGFRVCVSCVSPE